MPCLVHSRALPGWLVSSATELAHRHFPHFASNDRHHLVRRGRFIPLGGRAELPDADPRE